MPPNNYGIKARKKQKTTKNGVTKWSTPIKHKNSLKKKNIISKIIEDPIPFKIQNPLLSSIIKFGTYPNLLFLYLIATKLSQLTTGYLVGLVTGTIGLNILPSFIWYYDQKMLPNFFSKMTNLVKDQEKLFMAIKKYMEFFHTNYKIPLGIIGALFLFAFYQSPSCIKLEVYLEYLIPCFFAYTIDALLLLLIMGVGFVGVITGIFLVREISELDLQVDPLHPDNLGGLSSIGYFSIRSTLLFSAGSLYLPIAIQSGITAYPITALYMALISISFIYPTYRIHKKAHHIRTEILEELRNRIKELREELNKLKAKDVNEMKELKKELEMQNVREEYLDYNNVRLYPLQIDILIKLGSSIFLPLLFTLIQVYRLKIINFLV